MLNFISEAFTACEKGSLEDLLKVLPNIPSFNYIKNDKGNDLLHTACLNGKFEIVEYLFNNNANINSITPFSLKVGTLF